jgi:hypothetical protein
MKQLTSFPSKGMQAARVLAEDLVDRLRTWRRPIQEPSNPRETETLACLRRDGFVVVPSYWPRARALHLRDALEELLQAHTSSIDFPCGAYLRIWDNRAYDEGVRRIYHVERLLPELQAFRHDDFCSRLASAYYRVPIHSGLLMFQHNTRSNANTRYHHVDAFSKEFKAFLYLDDVDAGNGPFTYIRGSHRSHLTRLKKQLVGNQIGSPTSFSERDVRRMLNREVQVCGEAGTLILADVRGIHRGSPQIGRSRSALVNYMTRSKHDLYLDR